MFHGQTSRLRRSLICSFTRVVFPVCRGPLRVYTTTLSGSKSYSMRDLSGGSYLAADLVHRTIFSSESMLPALRHHGFSFSMRDTSANQRVSPTFV